MTSPEDLFLHYTSIEITHSKFIEITRKLDVEIPTLQKTDTPFQQSKGSTILKKKTREQAIGFNAKEDVGGVVNVLAGDFLHGSQNEPDR